MCQDEKLGGAQSDRVVGCALLSTVRASAAQLARAKTPEDRAKVDLKLHFMARTLDEPVRPFAQQPTSCQQQPHLPGRQLALELGMPTSSGRQIFSG